MSKRMDYNIGAELNKEKLVANVEIARPFHPRSLVHFVAFVTLPFPMNTANLKLLPNSNMTVQVALDLLKMERPATRKKT